MLVCKRAKRLKRKTLARRKRTRSLAILKQQRKAQRPRHRKYKQRTLWKVGVWNVRRWGAPNVPYDPWTKTCSIFKLARQRQWNVVLLTDVAFPESTPKQVKVDGITWSILVAGKVAVAMDNWATQTWIQGGKVQQVSSPDRGRALLVHLPREGYRKGLVTRYHSSVCSNFFGLRRKQNGVLP